MVSPIEQNKVDENILPKPINVSANAASQEASSEASSEGRVYRYIKNVGSFVGSTITTIAYISLACLVVGVGCIAVGKGYDYLVDKSTKKPKKFEQISLKPEEKAKIVFPAPAAAPVEKMPSKVGVPKKNKSQSEIANRLNSLLGKPPGMPGPVIGKKQPSAEQLIPFYKPSIGVPRSKPTSPHFVRT